jgi:hypothetical protein
MPVAHSTTPSSGEEQGGPGSTAEDESGCSHEGTEAPARPGFLKRVLNRKPWAKLG